MILLFLESSLGLYALGTVFSLIYLATLKEVFSRAALWLLGVGLVLHVHWFGSTAVRTGHLPISNLREALAFFALAIVGMYLVFALKFGVNVLGAFITPVATVLMFASVASERAEGPVLPILKSFWFPIHTVFSFFGNALFALAFAAGAMYLIQERQVKSRRPGRFFRRLPSLDALDRINYYCLSLGFSLLTMGILSGAVWAQDVWGSFWRWQPKEILALATWIFYAALLNGRIMGGWRGKRAAIFALIGFGAVLSSFLGVHLIHPGRHAFD